MVHLKRIANARSGDKGNIANIGLLAKKPKYYPIILEQVTEDVVKEHFQGICNGPVTRYELTNIEAVNFVLEDSLGGGGMRSLRVDNQGKTYSGALLRMEVELDVE